MTLKEYMETVDRITKETIKSFIEENREEIEKYMKNWYKIIIKSSDMVICSFTTSNYEEACEIEKTAHKMGYDVEWRF